MISSAIIRTPLLEGGTLNQEWQKFFVAVAGFDPRLTDLETLTAFFSSWSGGATPPVYISDSWGNLTLYPATSYPPLSLFYATDFTVFYTNTGSSWKFLSGTYAAVLGSIPGTLGGADLGFRFIATDYGHEYRWTGGGWTFAGGDASGYIVAVPTGGTPPIGGLWQICNGGAATVAKSDGTTQSITTPNLSTAPFLKGASAALVANEIQKLVGTGNANTIGLDWYMRR